MALLLVAAAAIPAQAAVLRVSTSAKQSGSDRVKFTAKLSRSAKVRVTVYRSGKVVKKLRAYKVSGRKYATSWSGRTVKAGTYTYKVTAKTASRTRTVRGKVKVRPVRTTPLADSRWIGMYVPGVPADMSALDEAEAIDGTHTAVINFYISDSESFPGSRVAAVANHGSIPLVTLEFWSIGSTGLSAITNGAKDSYLRNFADSAKAYGGEIWLRPFHEMNGNWYPWGGTVGNNSAAKAVAAWKHVRDIFAARGATNVKFVWCVNNDSVPNTTANGISAYWPGDEYVDYASIDGYNFGTYASWSKWRTFSETMGSAYAKVTSLTGKPIVIAETASVEDGGNKAEWITDMFATITSSYPQIVGVCWFNALKGEDWRIDSSDASARAFRNAIALGY